MAKSPYSVIPQKSIYTSGNELTAYQQNLSKPTEEKWYKGDQPTFRETLGRIASMQDTDPIGAQIAKNNFGHLMTTPGFSLYQPYLQVTNNAVSNLKSYGFDTSTLNDDWFKNNREWESYLVYNGTTNTPSSPGNKATTEQKVAYQLWQYSKARKDTAAVKSEWAAMKEELSYWANRKDRNMSDEDIVNKVKSNMKQKYPTLYKMYTSTQPGSGEALLELNEASEFSEDAMFGVLWAARNNGGSGNIFTDMANSARGIGNVWKEDPLIASKLLAGTDTYSPYSVGSTMEEEGLYFGMSEFNQKWLDENAEKYLNSNDATAKKYYQNVYDAEKYTQKLETQLADLKNEIEAQYAMNTYDPEIIIERLRDSGQFNDLFALDESMAKADLKDTTRAINYRWKDIENEIRAKCAEHNAKPKIADIADKVSSIASSPMNVEVDAVTSAQPVKVSTDTAKGPAIMPEKPTEQALNVLNAIPQKEIDLIVEEAATDRDAALEDIYFSVYGEPITTGEVEENKAKAEGLLQEILPSVSETPNTSAFTEAEVAVDTSTKADMDAISTAVQNYGTDSDKIAAGAGKTTLFEKAVDLIQKVSGDFVNSYKDLTTDNIIKEYWGNYSTIYGYNQHKENLEGSREFLESITPRYEELKTRNETGLSVEGLSAAENEALQNVSQSELEWCAWAAETDREAALESIYFSVYGSFLYRGDNIPEKEEKASKLLDAVLNAKPLTLEEQQEYAKLSRQKVILDTVIENESKYLSEHEEEYNQATMASEFYKSNYGQLSSFDGIDIDPGLIDKVERVYTAGQQKTMFSVPDYDGRVSSGESTRPDVNDAAVQDARGCELEIKDLEETLDYLSSIGVEMDEESVKNIRTRIESLRNVAIAAADVALDGVEGFTESAVNGKEKAKKSDSKIAKLVAGENVGIGTEVMLAGLAAPGFGTTMNPVSKQLAEYKTYANAMTEEEKNRFFYYMDNEGVEKAEEYFTRLTDPETGAVYKRVNQQMIEEAQEMASDNILNAAVATVASFGTKAQSLPAELLSGDYSYRNLTNALRSGSAEAIVDMFGAKDTDAEWFLKTGYQILTGLVDYKISSKAVDGFIGVIGDFLEGTNVAEALAEIGAQIGARGVNLAKGVAEVLPMSIYDASGTYQNVYNQTHDADKAAQMAYIDFIMGTISHTLITQGMHTSYKANPENFTQYFTGLMTELFKTAGVFGSTELGVNTIQEAVEHSILGADSMWGQSYERYSQTYPKAIAEKMADEDMQNYIFSKTGEQLATALLRTGITYTAGAIKNSEVGEKIQRTLYELKDIIRSRLQKSQGDISGRILVADATREYSIDEAGNIVVNNGLGLPGETDSDTDVQSITPISVKIRKTGEPVTVVGYRYDKGLNKFVYITDDNRTVPVGDMFSSSVIKDVMDLSDDEYSLLLDSYAWWSKKANVSESAPADASANEPAPQMATSSPIYAAPVPSTQTNVNYPEGAAVPTLTPAMTARTAKDLYIAQNVFLADNEAAAVGVASILNTGNSDADRAAGQTFVAKMCGGRTDVAASVIGRTLIESDGNPLLYDGGDVRDAIVYASLTSGRANKSLSNIIDKVKAGKQITSDDVFELWKNKRIDMTYKEIQKEFDDNIHNNVVSNAALQIAATKAPEVKKAKAKTKTAKANLTAAKKAAETAHATLAASAKNHVEATKEYVPEDPNAPVVPENAGIAQQTRNKVLGDKNAADAADAAVAVQERKVEEAVREENEIENQIMTEAHNEAEAVVQQTDAERTAALRAAQTQTPQVIPLQTAQPARLRLRRANDPAKLTTTGDSVQITGVLAFVPAPDQGPGILSGNAMGGSVVYGGGSNQGIDFTPEVRLRNSDYRPELDESFGVYKTPMGYVTDQILNGRRQTAILNILDEWESDARLENRRQNPINPAKWFNHSLKAATPSGEEVDIIGVAGITPSGNDALMDDRGRIYDYAELEFGGDPFTGTSADESYVALTEDIDFDTLPTVDESLIERGATPNVESPEPDNATAVKEPGNNAGELSLASGSDERPGNLHDAGSVGGEEEYGRGSESLPADDRQSESGINSRLLSKAARSKLQRKGVTSTALKNEPDPQRFSSALDKARENNPYKLFVDPQSPEELIEKGAIMLRSSDGKIVGAVGTKGKYDGDIFAVCKDPTSKAQNASKSIIIHAIAQGGNKLDCYSGTPTNPGLPRMYSSVGMIPIARVQFSRSFHENDGWNYERDGEPDVIFWMLKPGETADSVIAKYNKSKEEGGFHKYTMKELAKLPLFEDTLGPDGEPTEFGYDKAWEYRDKVLAGELPIPEVITPSTVNEPSTSTSVNEPSTQTPVNGSQSIAGEGRQAVVNRLNPVVPAHKPTTHAEKVKGELISPQRIAKRLVRSLGFGDYIGSNNFGNMSPLVRGYWDKHAQLVAVRNSNMGNYADTMHDIGHGIAQKLGMTGTPEMVMHMLDEEPEFLNVYQDEELKDEAFSEFLWRYMEDDERAKAFAGEDFVDEFERQLIRNPGMYKAVTEAKRQLRRWIGATSEERFQSMVRTEADPGEQKFKKLARTFINELIDNTSIAEDVDLFVQGNRKDGERGELRNTALFALSAQNRAVMNLSEHRTDANGTIVGDGLGASIAKTGFDLSKEKDRHVFEEYWLLRHSFSRDVQNKPVFGNMSASERSARMAEIEKTYPNIKEALDAAVSWWNGFTQDWLVDTGIWKQDFRDMLIETYPYYAPTFRIRKETDAAGNPTGFGRSGKRFSVHEATGGSEDIYSPLYSMIGMVDQITSMVATNQIAQEFDRLYQENEGMGVFGRQLPMSEPASNQPEGEMNSRQKQLQDLLKEQINEDLMEKVLEIAKSRPSNDNVKNSGQNILTVRRTDGTEVQYEIDNPELYKLLTGMQASSGMRFLSLVGKFTRTTSMLTTGSNPLFAVRNAVRDYQNSVNYGSWASNYITALPKWLASLYKVATNAPEYQEIKALGGGGWQRIEQGNSKSMSEVANTMFGDDKSSVGKTAKWLGKKLWHLVTMEKLNEWIEQASRTAEYVYGKHDRSTPEGRIKAFNAYNESTVDFRRGGNGELAYILKKCVRFFNANAQGAYRTTRQFTKAERGRAGIRFAKAILNTAIFSAVCLESIFRYGDKDDIDEFLMLSDGVKAGHFILKNPFSDGKNGQAPFIRIPIEQNPLSYLVHNLVTNALTKGEVDQWGLTLAATADMMWDNMNPIGSSIIQPFIETSHNRTWYGTNIVSPSMADWADKASQYDEDTPDLFIAFGRAINQSPEILEYLFTQYTGFIGALGIPALSKKSDGSIGGVDAMLKSAYRKWTADPLTSNDATKAFYNMAGTDGILQTIIDQAKVGRGQGLLLRSLTSEETDAAYEEAKAMMSSGGIAYETKKKITDTYKYINTVNANPDLSEDDKTTLIREAKKNMLDMVLVANEELMAYQKKYIQGNTLLDRVYEGIRKRSEEGNVVHIKTDIEKMPKTFQNDSDVDYMQRSLSVYNGPAGSGLGGGNSAALPHPSYTFTKDEKEYAIPEDERETYDAIYKKYYSEYITGAYGNLKWSKKAREWDTLSDKDKYEVLKNAAKYANGKMEDAYVQVNKNN